MSLLLLPFENLLNPSSSMFQQGSPSAHPRPVFSAMGHPLARIAAIAAILALAHYRWMQFPWRMPLVGIVGIALVWLETRSLSACGLQHRPLRAWFGWTLLLLALVVGFVNPVMQPLIDALTGTKADYSGYGALLGNFNAAAHLAGGAWLSAALGEELVFRAFLMHHLDHLLGRHRGGQVMAAVAGGALFGAMHLTQGISGVLLTGLVGALFGYVYLRSGRNLRAMILAHGLIDTWGIATLYLGWY
ncbi:hypothetical protein FHT08_003308 [Xanthomonas campestris]|nr:hypothetical protein [Xanthomonas sp. CFBP 8152]NIJ78188.1 hypothetical protein [Xanthomonas sp. CFBP 8151]